MHTRAYAPLPSFLPLLNVFASMLAHDVIKAEQSNTPLLINLFALFELRCIFPLDFIVLKHGLPRARRWNLRVVKEVLLDLTLGQY